MLLLTTFFVSFLSSTRKVYIFALSPTNSVMIASLFSYFKPRTFLLLFHNVTHVVALDEINKTVRISVYYFTFFAIQHIIVMKFIQTCLGYVEDTNINWFVELHPELMHSYRNQILRKDTTTGNLIL